MDMAAHLAVFTTSETRDCSTRLALVIGVTRASLRAQSGVSFLPTALEEAAELDTLIPRLWHFTRLRRALCDSRACGC